MNTLLKTITLLLAIAGSIVTHAEPPNIIIVYADDVGYGDLGCYGATKVQTPNLDRMAQQGLRFTSAYASASTCTPSRYSLLTGEYAFRNKEAIILPGNAPMIINPGKPTIASVLKSKGYTTGLVGKWHIGLGKPNEPLDWNGNIAPGPREVGFDYSFHMAATGDRVPTVYIQNGKVVNLDPKDPIKVNYLEPIGNEPTGISNPQLMKMQADEQHAKTIVNGISRVGYMTGGHAARWVDSDMSDTFLGKALEFIKTNKDKPFFLFYATQENHVPRIPHPRFQGSSGLGARGDALVEMDWNIGVLLETLEQQGLSKNTLIIFSSDNGPALFDGYYDGAMELNGDHKPAGPWRGGKYSAWEGGTRMPFIVYGPKMVNAGVSDALISQVDLLASLAALANAKVPKGAAPDSQNLLNTLLGKSETGRDYLIQQGVKMESIRKGPWKYIPEGEVTNRGKIGIFYTDKIKPLGQLYFLPEDPMEQKDLSNLYPEKVKELRALLDKEVGAQSARVSTVDQLGGAVRKP